MQLDPDHCYAAIKARDARFDGLFFVGVSTTGIYCRPVCAVRTPGRDRCSYYANAASAEAAGYRPCLRCRPELAPGSSPNDATRRLADIAVARIEAGSAGSLEELAAELSISSRQLRRVVEREYGVTPVALAQTRRLLLAKQLLTDTPLKMADVAYAAGFDSLRRFNHLFRTRYGLNPGALRRKAVVDDGSGSVTLRLGYRPPLAWTALAGFLSSRGVTSVERLEGQEYRRSVRIGEHRGWIAVTPARGQPQLLVTVAPTLLPVLGPLLAKLRRLFDLDAHPGVIEAQLSRDPRLGAWLRATPGLRIPGTLDGFELALRAILGQQITVKAATTVFGRFAEHFGEPIVTPWAGLDRLAPRAEALADASLEQIIRRGVTSKRAETVQGLARAVAEQRIRLEPSAAPEETARALLALPGIGPWTAQYIALRALGDPDAFPTADLGLMKALAIDKPAALLAAAEPWRPWRGYAAIHIWHHLSSGG
ncbi:MAG TPA: AlkA N-terminal domain-containing protein [Burkholderiaceae bacterium]|nr:AlkA N-terminal domain-containing protein [Burkholderiaceae bacterium]